jgi:hypothetical protein
LVQGAVSPTEADPKPDSKGGNEEREDKSRSLRPSEPFNYSFVVYPELSTRRVPLVSRVGQDVKEKSNQSNVRNVIIYIYKPDYL